MAVVEVPPQLVQGVKRFEGLHKVVRRQPGISVVPYICPAGYWTIGYGSLCQQDHPPITEAEAEALLLAQLPVYMGHALRLSPVLWLEDWDRLTAISSFVFNLGPTRYAGSTLRRVVNARDWPGARVQIKKWVYGGGRVLPGLVARRAWEAALL